MLSPDSQAQRARRQAEIPLIVVYRFPGPALDTGRKIFVQCETGGRATLATKQLQDVGFTNVVAVVMNFAEWQKNGHPFEK
jgi:rhodanese-related sulfurtransferase